MQCTLLFTLLTFFTSLHLSEGRIIAKSEIVEASKRTKRSTGYSTAPVPCITRNCLDDKLNEAAVVFTSWKKVFEEQDKIPDDEKQIGEKKSDESEGGKKEKENDNTEGNESSVDQGGNETNVDVKDSVEKSDANVDDKHTDDDDEEGGGKDDGENNEDKGDVDEDKPKTNANDTEEDSDGGEKNEAENDDHEKSDSEDNTEVEEDDDAKAQDRGDNEEENIDDGETSHPDASNFDDFIDNHIEELNFQYKTSNEELDKKEKKILIIKKGRPKLNNRLQHIKKKLSGVLNRLKKYLDDKKHSNTEAISTFQVYLAQVSDIVETYLLHVEEYPEFFEQLKASRTKFKKEYLNKLKRFKTLSRGEHACNQVLDYATKFTNEMMELRSEIEECISTEYDNLKKISEKIKYGVRAIKIKEFNLPELPNCKREGEKCKTHLSNRARILTEIHDLLKSPQCPQKGELMHKKHGLSKCVQNAMNDKESNVNRFTNQLEKCLS